MENALYYTFSTIAQALAAAIALLGAFTLYRLQLLQAAMLEAATILRTHTSADRGKVDAAYIVADYFRVFELVRAADTKSQLTEIRAGLEKFSRLLGEKRSVLRTFQVALVASVIVILGSVIVLAFAPVIVRTPLVALVLGIGCVSLGVCLGLYARLLLGHVS
ncbi:MAG TPA: hypothetical protein VG454_06085 [Gemmatimonadales bacterium]|nr:hypothetical protein [Gemmatimonadales bacterium]